MKRIPLRDRAGKVLARAIVDDEDYPLVADVKWSLDSGYAGRRAWVGGGKYERVKMHRLIMGVGRGDPRHVDHINRDRLDNRRANLRLVAGRREQVQNRPSWGRSKHRGVSWHKRVGRWQARGKVDGVTHHLGYFDDEAEAGRVASAWRKENLPLSAD